MMVDQDLNAEVELKISVSPSVIYEAIVNPSQMAGYFISSGSGRLDSGEGNVTWKWDDCGAELIITPQAHEADRRVCFLWPASGVEARVVIELESQQDVTNVKITETGWPTSSEGITRCLQQTQGWMHMLCCLKAYVEHGINLRN